MTESTAGGEATTEFDAYTEDYDVALERGLRLSGEPKAYFAKGRVSRLVAEVVRLGLHPRRILEFGCGYGNATKLLCERFNAERVVGVDISEGLLTRARRDHRDQRIEFLHVEKLEREPIFDVAFCNGVFHHIRPHRRDAAVGYIRDRLRPGGLFGFFENNPWNPGTTMIMRRIPFDRDAIMLSAPEARSLLKKAGLSIKRTEYLFFFPRPLAFLRPLERALSRIPLGAQYLVSAVR